MKTKSLLFGLLASAAMVSCTNEVDSIENIGANQKGEQSYLAVNLSAITRTTPTFEAGSAVENEVSKVAFFFFDAAGNAYDVTGNGKNRLDKDYTPDPNEEFTGDVNVEESSTPILVIEKSKQVPPQKIVAVLNCPISEDNISLSDLQGKVGAYNTITVDGKTYFVMSNSVYKNEATGEEMVATDIPALSISHSSAAALANPVTIYVERVAAKVAVTASYATGETSFSTGISTSKGKAINAIVEGWEVVNAKTQARLLKDIDPTWSFAWNWNAAGNYRSYWATNTTDENIIRELSWDMEKPAYRYYYENTDVEKFDDATTTQLEGNQSYLLVKASFVDEDGTVLSGENAVAEWYGAKYTFADLKAQFANAVATQIYVKTGDKTAKSIEPKHITFYQEDENEAAKRYLCYATLDSKTTKDLVFVSGVDEDGEFITMTVGEVNNILAGIRPAKIWEAGGYYYLPIAHNATVNGLVRNHVYQMDITGVTGLGTPVYDPEKIIRPEKPVQDESFISADIKVLSWKVVINDVVLQ